MVTIVGVRFKRVGRIYYFDPRDLTDLQTNEWVVVETAKGTEVGRVVIAPRQVEESVVSEPLKPVLRRAMRQDILLQQYYRAQRAETLAKAKERVAAHNLPMKLVEADYSFDGSRLTISFTAEGRVDFRELVKDLASVFKTRIELRQIGDRDEAKAYDGMGQCGRQFCCTSWLSDFPTVSIKMAKEQDLPLNPSKITGSCGRLLCCLSYENDLYAAAKHGLPKVGEEIDTPSGRGVIVSHNVLKGTVTVELKDTSKHIDIPTAELPRKGALPAAATCAACHTPPRQPKEREAEPEQGRGREQGKGKRKGRARGQKPA